MRLAYPIKISSRDGVCNVWFPDFPEASVEGVSRQLVRTAAKERLIETLYAYVREHRDIPRPTYMRRQRDVMEPPLLMAVKLALYQTMRDQNISNVALAKRLGTVEGTVRRLVDPGHRSHIDRVEQALALLGKRLVVDMWTA